MLKIYPLKTLNNLYLFKKHHINHNFKSFSLKNIKISQINLKNHKFYQIKYKNSL